VCRSKNQPNSRRAHEANIGLLTHPISGGIYPVKGARVYPSVCLQIVPDLNYPQAKLRKLNDIRFNLI